MPLKTEINKMDSLKRLLFQMADDLLILGHRNSEWTGIGPVLEEDIAFASMAQDKIGQAQALYRLINEIFGFFNCSQVYRMPRDSGPPVHFGITCVRPQAFASLTTFL